VQVIEYRRATPVHHAHAAAPSLAYADGPGPLHVRFLQTARERQAIAALRRHAAFGVEQDLGLGLQPFEQERDEIGLVTAAYRHERVLATLRLVPTGHGLTGAERLLEKVRFDGRILGEGSWELGRVIMEPEDRHPDLLAQCLRLTLMAVMEHEEVRDFHATTTLAMARLWRRVGMRTVLTTSGESGTRYCLVHGTVASVAAALQVPCETAADSMPAPLLMTSRSAQQAPAHA
jgi:predicted GNAT family N-acyltransferase